MILIGGQALNALSGKPFSDKDFDIVCTPEEAECLPERVDVHPVAFLNNAEIEQRFDSGHTVALFCHSVKVCSLRGLAAIKRSHLWRDLAFDKHIAAYHKRLVAHLAEEDIDFVERRAKLTRKAFPQGAPSLKKTNEDFFDDAVAKVYDHDRLHEFVAFYDEPLYTRLKTDQSKAWCERRLWDALTHKDKCRCVAEETYVISIERFMVRHDWAFPARRAYFAALKKVCTTLTSGWFRDFAIDNYPAIVELFDQGRFDAVKKRLEVEHVEVR